VNLSRRVRKGPKSRVRVLSAKKSTAAQLHGWRVAILRKRGEVLGFVEAADHASAETIAITEFKLSAEERKRLLIQERL
jgi:hypothetical protein